MGTGTISEDFYLIGSMPVEKGMLKIAVIIGEIEEAVSFNMRATILSKPVALLTSSEVFPTEKHICDLLYEHFNISDQLWGFQASKSTTNANLSATNEWFIHLENGLEVQLSF